MRSSPSANGSSAPPSQARSPVDAANAPTREKLVSPRFLCTRWMPGRTRTDVDGRACELQRFPLPRLVADVEGWGLYREAITLPYMPPEGKRRIEVQE